MAEGLKQMAQILRTMPHISRQQQDNIDAVLWQSIIDAYHHADETDDMIELSDIIPAGFPEPGLSGHGRTSWRWHRV
jgi:hypothetical protein